MSKQLAAAAIALILGGAFLVGSPANAQQRMRCSEGRTMQGQCVNPALAAQMRHRGVHMNQVMINQWMYPFPPSHDGTYPRGFDVNRFESSQDGTGSTNPFPPSH